MFSPSPAVRRRHFARATLLACLIGVLAACGSQTPTPRPSGASANPSGSAAPTPTPIPTAQPTPRYTNPPDPALARIIPGRVNGVRITVPDHSQFAYTPGDMVPAYGDLALRFSALQVAFVPDPRLSLYVARVEGELPTTRQLEPHLATAAQYVGIAGLHRKPWHYRTIGGRVTWVRPEDDATALGTMIYTWTGGEYLFLLMGVDDQLNRALFAALPGEEAPAPQPSSNASASPTAGASASAEASSGN
ncbi:MAG TPA: hypothetical protein VF153_05510 [Candidatus Limnocylindria bacterium]